MKQPSLFPGIPDQEPASTPTQHAEAQSGYQLQLIETLPLFTGQPLTVFIPDTSGLPHTVLDLRTGISPRSQIRKEGTK